MSSTDSVSTPAAADSVERLFAGDFGAAYTDRNHTADPRKPAFFHELFLQAGARRVLECGANVGLNLTDAARDENLEVWGLDIQRLAVQRAAANMPSANFVVGSLFDLPFKDGWFDIAFTCGVLIHVPPAGLLQAMTEIHRVSGGHVLCAEYHDEQEVEVPYRGHSQALWRRNYGQMYLDAFPDLQLVAQGYKAPEEGFDRITWHLFRKR